MSIKNWVKKNPLNLSNKTIVITGSTGGLGKEICNFLVSSNANLVLACRNFNLAQNQIQQLKQLNNSIKIDFVPLDLSSKQSIDECILKLKEYNGIDVLINNAGVYNVPIKKLALNLNNVFFINFLGTYYLTKKLLPELEKKENSTCITLGSVAHNYSKLNENDIDFSTCKKSSLIYGNSKRFLMFSLYELFKTSKVNLAIVHPGVTLTNMTNHYPKAINWLVKIGIKLLFPSPKKAVLSIIYGINHPTNYHEWIGPKVFNVWGYPKHKKLKTCTPKESQKIYNIAQELYQKLDKEN